MKKLYIETVGCQMNVLDSELVVASLRKDGYELTGSTAEADTILFNTCSVRQQAEDKIYSALGRLKDAKSKNPDKVIGVMGCMAQKDQKLIFSRAPFVDIVVGPGQLHQVPALVREARDSPAGRRREQRLEVSLGRRDGRNADVKRSHESFDPLRDPTMRPTPFQAYVRIQIGCDKFCTYCIVPSVRGPEQSRPPSHILAEARQLADEGCKEITLLGQTVNSWRVDEDGRRWRFSDLLRGLHDIDGLERIKFVTSYPRDMTDDVLESVRDLPKLCKYLHVPAQHGSDVQLRRMRRGYTIAEYREMHERAKRWMPDVAITSDFIVGFSGETEDEFRQTMDLVEECRFKNSFIFKYSVRPGTKAAERLPDDVPDEVKRLRNNELLQLQNRISEEDNHRFLEQRVDVLVEGPSKKAAAQLAEAMEQNGSAPRDPHAPLQLTGRTMCDRIVVFEGNARQIGQTLPVAVYDANAHTLFGAVVTEHVTPEVFSLAGSPPAEQLI
ncbi:MAG: tRNA (N6-isopentenyl adenosine(37)-C2)-methylthiotransferase MiaB [Planctomycetota bacterium]